MGPETIVTLIGVALIVGALAAYLIIIAYSLYKVSFTLGTVLIGVRAIAARCEPLRGVVGAIASDVSAVEQAMRGLTAGPGSEHEGPGYEEEDEEEEEEEAGYGEAGYQEDQEAEDEEYEEVEVVELQRPRLRRTRVRR